MAAPPETKPTRTRAGERRDQRRTLPPPRRRTSRAPCPPVPSFPRRLPTRRHVPSIGLSTENTPFSVSTSAITSPRVTVLPGRRMPLDQRAELHVGARATASGTHRRCVPGVGSTVALGANPLTRRRSHGPRRRSAATCGSAACSRCRAYGIGTSAPHTRADGRVEIVERVLHDARADLRREAAAAPFLVHDHGAVRPAHRREHRVHVERTQRAQVDDLHADARRPPAARRPRATRPSMPP